MSEVRLRGLVVGKKYFTCSSYNREVVSPKAYMCVQEESVGPETFDELRKYFMEDPTW